jgi:hypothetical protein
VLVPDQEVMTRFAIVATAFALNACAAVGSSGPSTAALRDGAAFVPVLTTTAGNDAETRRYELHLGDAVFTGDYFAAEGDEPSLRVAKLDREHEVVVLSIPHPVDCRYRVFGDAGSTTLELASLTSAHCRAEPRFEGDGTFAVAVWEGFWERAVVYTRQRDGTFAPSAGRYFPVGLSSRAARAGTAGALAIAAGATVRVVRYDLAERRYELETGDGRGWIDAAGLSNLLPDLPWAE